MWLFCLLAMTS